jgi:hypothetical protein
VLGCRSCPPGAPKRPATLTLAHRSSVTTCPAPTAPCACYGRCSPAGALLALGRATALLGCSLAVTDLGSLQLPRSRPIVRRLPRLISGPIMPSSRPGRPPHLFAVIPVVVARTPQPPAVVEQPEPRSWWRWPVRSCWSRPHGLPVGRAGRSGRRLALAIVDRPPDSRDRDQDRPRRDAARGRRSMPSSVGAAHRKSDMRRPRQPKQPWQLPHDCGSDHADRLGRVARRRPRPRPGTAHKAAGLDDGTQDVTAQTSAACEAAVCWGDEYAVKRLAEVRAV